MEIKQAIDCGAYDCESVLDVTTDRVLSYLEREQQLEREFARRLAEDATEPTVEYIE